MKRKLIGLLMVGLVIWLGWRYVDPGRLFADVYYVKVPSAETVERVDDGYRYELIGYDQEGKKRSLTIPTPTLLVEGDFLKVYVKEEDQEVTDYERADASEVPLQLKEEQMEDASPHASP